MTTKIDLRTKQLSIPAAACLAALLSLTTPAVSHDEEGDDGGNAGNEPRAQS
jgi:hypothetical protein